MTDHLLAMQDVCVAVDASIRAAVEKMDVNCLGVVFVTDKGRLVGVLSDGDFRRAVLRQAADLDASVSTIMNVSPSTLSVGAGAEETFFTLAAGLEEGKKVFPRIDAEGFIRDFSYREHWGLLPVAEPELTGSEAAYVLQCVEQNWISSSGPFVSRFEQDFAAFTQLSHPVAVSNGTVALTLALQALQLGLGAEVIVPSVTFAATANAVVAAGGVPVLSDVDPVTWGLSPALVEPLISERTRVIIPVHLYGSPCDIPGLRELADARDLLLVEDCAEAIGTTSGAGHVGGLSDAATFSFFGNKTLTTGEGGMVFFRDSGTEQRARQLRDHGMSHSRKYWHEVVGYNYRLTNLQAAIGVAQVERADSLVSRKRHIGHLCEAGIAQIPGLTMMPVSPFGESSYWLVPVLIAPDLASHRDMLMELLASDGIQTRVTFPALHTMPAFAPYPRAADLPVSDDIARRGLCLPNTPRMSDESVAYIMTCLASNMGRITALARGEG